MSSTDSFVDEVTEELRRERLYRLGKRYGWIPLSVIIVIIGGAVWYELRQDRMRISAEAFGDAVLSGLSEANANTSLGLIRTDTDGQALLLRLITAAGATTDLSFEEIGPYWTAEAESANISDLYRDLMYLKGQFAGGTGDEQRDLEILGLLSQPNAPFAVLALEQLAILHLKAGDNTQALSILREIPERADATQFQQERIQQMIDALGGSKASGE